MVVFCFQQKEFEWVLNKEVHAVLNQLHTILVVSIVGIHLPYNVCIPVQIVPYIVVCDSTLAYLSRSVRFSVWPAEDVGVCTHWR